MNYRQNHNLTTMAAPKGNRNGKQFSSENQPAPESKARGKRITSELLALLDKSNTAKVIAQKLIEGAKEGKLDFIREVIDRTEGKPKQGIQMEVNEKETVKQVYVMPDGTHIEF